jgi:predicted MFS family arabinose efflux permease
MAGSAKGAWWGLALLSAASFFNYLDRMVIAVLVEPMKRDLGLSDTQMGLVSGLAFALLYATAGLPLARLADRGRRVPLLATCLAAWSLMTALTGQVRNFLELFLVRMGVGIGEAGCVPAAHSLIADYFPPERRALALGIFQAGGLLGLTIGLAIAGWLADTQGWRTALLVVGLAGLPLALLIALALPEPARGHSAGPPPAESALVAIKALLARPVFLQVLLGISVGAFAAYGKAQWYPAFYVRSHGLTLTQIGFYGSLASGLGGIIGILAGGAAMIRLRQRDPRWELWLPMAGYLAAIPFALLTLWLADYRMAFLAQFLAVLAAASGGGASLAALQGQAEPHRRATAAALMLILSSLIGLGLGPVAVGSLSDLLTPRFGADGLRIAMLCATTIYAWAALHFALAARAAARNHEPALPPAPGKA